MSNIYWGKETKKAQKNFPFAYEKVHTELIYAVVEVKKAAALANSQTGALNPQIAQLLVMAGDEIIAGKHAEAFQLPGLQGGAGTSINMNVNEVLANRATELANFKIVVHPNDHVNLAQSTNDVNPTALKIALIRLTQNVIEAITQLEQAFQSKSSAFAKITKLGRTHLQDAVPTTLGAEFASFAATTLRAKKRIAEVLPYLHEVSLGGTAVGNSINAPVAYQKAVYQTLAEVTKLPLKPAENLMSPTSSQTDFCQLSQALVLLTLDLSKIASDLRLLASGPNGGFGEIMLAELQSGSSIMPGKVNPIMLESLNQLYFLVSGNNLTIEHAAHASQLELGVMFPILADRLLTSIKIIPQVLTAARVSCIETIQAREKNCKKHLENSTAYATLLTPTLGYEVVTQVVKESLQTGKTIRQLVLEKNLLTESEFEAAIRL